jgi:uncharacterized protein YerC
MFGNCCGGKKNSMPQKMKETRLIRKYFGEDATLMLKSVLEPVEIFRLENRLKTAELLHEGFSYREIAKKLNVSTYLVAKVFRNVFLNEDGRLLAEMSKFGLEQVERSYRKKTKKSRI